MKSPEDQLLGILYFALAGLFWYLFRRFESRKEPESLAVKVVADVQQKPKPDRGATWKRRLAETSIVVTILGLIYGIPEYSGRSDASEMCASVPVGERFITDNNVLYANRNQVKDKFGTFFAASYHPKIKGIEDGNGAVVLVFLAGFPFSRAYCVLHVNESVVQSKQVMFNAEDYEYCDGKMRGVWECSE